VHFYFAPRGGVKYCNVCVCVSVCPLAYLSNDQLLLINVRDVLHYGECAADT